MDYCKTKEGVQAFEKIGLKYPRDFSDEQYEKYLDDTSKSPKDKTFVEIRKMNRVLLPDGTQWIVHDHNDIRLDKIGKQRNWTRGNIGRYPVPIPYYDILYVILGNIDYTKVTGLKSSYLLANTCCPPY